MRNEIGKPKAEKGAAERTRSRLTNKSRVKFTMQEQGTRIETDPFKSGKMCAGVKKDGKPCNWQAMPGSSFCLIHDNSEESLRRKHEMRSKGGKSRKAVLPACTPHCKINSFEDARVELNATVDQVRTGELDPKTGSIVGNLILASMKAIALRDGVEGGDDFTGTVEAMVEAIARMKDRQQLPAAPVLVGEPVIDAESEPACLDTVESAEPPKEGENADI